MNFSSNFQSILDSIEIATEQFCHEEIDLKQYNIGVVSRDKHSGDYIQGIVIRWGIQKSYLIIYDGFHEFDYAICRVIVNGILIKEDQCRFEKDEIAKFIINNLNTLSDETYYN